MNRFSCTVLVTLLLVTLLLGPGGLRAGEAQRLNLLVITVDDMSADSIGAFGCKLPDTTPNIDRLARQGLRFTRAHVQVGNCMPSRNVMWSGRYPHNNGVEGFYQVPSPGYPVLVDLMRDAGYFTAIRHKVSHSTPYHPYAWDLVLDTLPDGTRADVKDPVSYGVSTSRGIRAAQAEGKPFCLLINIADPHKPFHAQARTGETIADPNRPSRVFTPHEPPTPGFLFQDAVVSKELAHYYSSVRRADDGVGHILRALEQSGQAEDTLVMFLSDHGMPLPFAKTQLYHHSTHTPLIVRWPGVTKAAGADGKHMVSAVDFLPTLLDAVGVAHPQGIDGRSFAPLLHGRTQTGREMVIKEYNENAGGSRDPMRAVQTKRFLYLFNPWSNGERIMATATTGTPTYRRMAELAQTDEKIAARHDLYQHRVVEELYDVENDPDCLVNLIDGAAHRQELARLREALEEWMVETGDHMLEAFRQRDDPAVREAYVQQKEKEAEQRKLSRTRARRPRAKAAAAARPRPNVILIMADDLGFADLGCYGSEIDTPTLDSLAAGGLRFTQFYNTAKCHSSRVSLLTGLYCDQAGGARLSRGATIAEVLSEAGYFTAMVGKWHLSGEPTDFGFGRYWGHLSGATNFFTGDKSFRLNGQPWDVPETLNGRPFYTTHAVADFALEFLEEAARGDAPFLLYAAFNAPHYPLQAPQEAVRRYDGRYDEGWDRLRLQRHRRQLESGLLPAKWKLSPRPDHVPAWESLSDEERRWEADRMEVFAAMVDVMDRSVGRLVAFLKQKGIFDNTLILFCSDNGACPFERTRGRYLKPWDPRSYWTYDAAWAHAGNTPLRLYKQNQHEGGISSPLIVHWPGGLKTRPGAVTDQPGHLIDFMATFVELTGATYPDRIDDRRIDPLQGKSLLPIFRGQTRPPHETLYFHFGTDRALRQGPWKLVSAKLGRWELYNMEQDRTELNDLSAQDPDRVAAMAAEWFRTAEQVDRLQGRSLTPVRDRITSLSFRRDTSSGAASRESRKSGKKKETE